MLYTTTTVVGKRSNTACRRDRRYSITIRVHHEDVFSGHSKLEREVYYV